MINVAVIGSNGFIGAHLTKRLSQLPEVNLFLFGRNEKSAFDQRFSYEKMDLMSRQQIMRSFENIDLVYYLASETIPATSWENPRVDIDKNLVPFIHFMDCISLLKVKKVVFLSSAGTVYGVSDKPLRENSDKTPFSPYGILKLTMENFLSYYQIKYGIHHDIFRVSNAFGEGQNTSKGLGIINTFLEKIIQDQKVTVFGDGNNIRNYIYVKDLADILSLSVSNDLTGSNTLNLSSHDTLSINELIETIAKVVPHKFEVVYKPARLSDNPVIKLDNQKLLKIYPNIQFTKLEEAIQKTYQSLLNR